MATKKTPTVKPKSRPYMTIAGSITGTLVRQGILDVKGNWRTFNPAPWMEIVENELAEYFANKEYKAMLDSPEALFYSNRKIVNLQKKIFKKHGLIT